MKFVEFNYNTSLAITRTNTRQLTYFNDVTTNAHSIYSNNQLLNVWVNHSYLARKSTSYLIACERQSGHLKHEYSTES